MITENNKLILLKYTFWINNAIFYIVIEFCAFIGWWKFVSLKNSRICYPIQGREEKTILPWKCHSLRVNFPLKSLLNRNYKISHWNAINIVVSIKIFYHYFLHRIYLHLRKLINICEKIYISTFLRKFKL